MGYNLNTPEVKEVTTLKTESFSATNATIKNFSFNDEGECMSFSVEWKNTAGDISVKKDFNLDKTEFTSLVAANVPAMQAMRAAIWNYLKTKGEIGAGSDTWPVGV